MATNETVTTAPLDRPEGDTRLRALSAEMIAPSRPMRPTETPEASYRRLTQRPDIQEILRRLADH